MHYALRVAVISRLQHLLYDLGSIVLAVGALLGDLIEQLAALAQLGHQEVVSVVFKYLVDLDNVRMVEHPKSLQLALEELLLRLVHLLLLDYLYCAQVFHFLVLALSYLAKRAGTNDLADGVVVLELALADGDEVGLVHGELGLVSDLLLLLRLLLLLTGYAYAECLAHCVYRLSFS